MQEDIRMHRYRPLLQVAILIILAVPRLRIFPERIPTNGFGLTHRLVMIETKRRIQLVPFPLHRIVRQLKLMITFLLTLERGKQKCQQPRLLPKSGVLKKRHGIC